MKFTSVELQKAFDKARPVLENITQTKNTISNEIKSLEKFFQSHSIAENFTLEISSPIYPRNLTQDSNGNLIANEENLVWDAEKKRIIFQHSQYVFEDYEEYHSMGTYVKYDVDSKQIVLSRPLIETSFETRKKVYELHLSNFLLELSSKYDLNMDNDPF